jgi:hypothetical protein
MATEFTEEHGKISIDKIGLRKLSPTYADYLALSGEWFIRYTTLECG